MKIPRVFGPRVGICRRSRSRASSGLHLFRSSDQHGFGDGIRSACVLHGTNNDSKIRSTLWISGFINKRIQYLGNRDVTAESKTTIQNRLVPIMCCITQKGFWRPWQLTQIPLYNKPNRK